MDKTFIEKQLYIYIKDNYEAPEKKRGLMKSFMGAAMAKSSAMVMSAEVCKDECLDIDDFLKNEYKKETVSDYLNRVMARDNITTSLIYRRCYIDRKLISKISKGDGYHPSKDTMLSLCIGLNLGIEEANHFLSLGGFDFNPGRLYDIIIKYFLVNKIFDIDIINEMLYKYGQSVIGQAD